MRRLLSRPPKFRSEQLVHSYLVRAIGTVLYVIECGRRHKLSLTVCHGGQELAVWSAGVHNPPPASLDMTSRRPRYTRDMIVPTGMSRIEAASV